VAGGRVFVMGHRDSKECVLALSTVDGGEVWTAVIGPAAGSGVVRLGHAHTPPQKPRLCEPQQPAHHRAELERCDDRYRQILKTMHTDGGALEKIRREMSGDEENRWDHERQIEFKRSGQ